MSDTLFTFAHVTDVHMYDESDAPSYREPCVSVNL